MADIERDLWFNVATGRSPDVKNRKQAGGGTGHHVMGGT